MSVAWGGEDEPALDWTQTDLIRHQNAFTIAKADFVRLNGYAPTTSAELSSVMRRAEAIRKGEIESDTERARRVR